MSGHTNRGRATPPPGEKRKRKEHHHLPFYEEILTRITDPWKLQGLLDDAASQPEKFLSAEDYEKLYWRVYDITKGELV